MIGGFKDEETKRIFFREKSRRYASLSRSILRKLLQIEAAVSLEQLQAPPGNRLELLRGDRAGQHSIRINDQFRLCFFWKEGYAYDLEITDYH